jgi:predicted flap endonuclease-1-like 5' DNA nuclease
MGGLFSTCLKTSNRGIKMNVKEIEGIGAIYADKLRAQGIVTVRALLEMSSSRKSREKLAERIGVSDTKILEWANRADLMRIKGIGGQYSDLLEYAGVDSPRELSSRRAENLAAKLNEINKEKKLVKRIPNLAQVQAWIDAAKALDVVISH